MPPFSKHPLTIGIDGRELYPDLPTGIGRYLRNFLDAAVPAYPDCRFIVYGNQHTALDLQAPNLSLKIIPETLTFWWDQITLARALRQDNADVLLSPYEKGPYVAPCPVVLTVYDLLFYDISDRGPFGTWIYNAAHRILRGPLIRRAARVITDSLYSKHDIVQKLNVPEQNIRPVPIGIPDSYRPVRDQARIEAFKKAHDIKLPYLLYVGNFKPHKNVPRLLEAYAGLPEALRSDHLLVLCGRKDHHREAVQAQAQKLGLTPHLRFLDFVDDADMPVLYSGARLFTFPSLY
ncbi:MAG: glycosyltransferase family 1 protein, partial [bacterium]|nr:glycosyltransferase family 1 protein [bacterium]